MVLWRATVLTLFPEIFPGPLQYSLAGKGLKRNIWQLETLNIRDFSSDKHKTVDDLCFGGGPGMVLKPDVVHKALKSSFLAYSQKPAVIYVTPRGEPLKQHKVRSLVDHYPSGAIILCGRYEGIDDRVIEYWRKNHNLEEVSLGDYVLSGGEMAALTLMDACVRLLPGIVHSQESLESESFELDLLEFPHYTRPQNWKNKNVPDVLLSGNHKKIKDWRLKQAEQDTQKRRPDLWQTYLYKRLHSGQT